MEVTDRADEWSGQQLISARVDAFARHTRKYIYTMVKDTIVLRD